MGSGYSFEKDTKVPKPQKTAKAPKKDKAKGGKKSDAPVDPPAASGDQS